MSLTLFYGSGSPYAWRVQLALEHKALPYERKVLSFSAGDTRKPEFLALNPRHRVPVLVDEDFVLYESNAIVEEIGMFTRAMRGEFLAGPLSAADFALYPLVAFVKRCEMKLPDLDAE